MGEIAEMMLESRLWAAMQGRSMEEIDDANPDDLMVEYALSGDDVELYAEPKSQRKKKVFYDATATKLAYYAKSKSGKTYIIAVLNGIRKEIGMYLQAGDKVRLADPKGKIVTAVLAKCVHCSHTLKRYRFNVVPEATA